MNHGALFAVSMTTPYPCHWYSPMRISYDGHAVLSMSEKLAALETAIHDDDNEEAVGHLIDLLLHVGNRARPEYVVGYETVSEVLAFHGREPQPIDG